MNDVPVVQRGYGLQNRPENLLILCDGNIFLSEVEQVMRKILEDQYSMAWHAVERLPNVRTVLYPIVEGRTLFEILRDLF